MDILVDSNLAHMFGPEGAAVYFARLLKADVRSLRPTMSQEWPHAFFITSSTVQQNAAPPTLYINRRPAHLLDYTIRQVGTVVPQGIWPPGNTSADTPSRGSAKPTCLNMPVFFVGMDRISLGLPLPVAIAEGDRVSLQGAGSPAQIGHGSTTYIRITWPGYSEWTTQIMTRDQTPAQNTITLGKFAKRLASAVGRFMDEAQRLACQNPNWRIGGGGITKEQVILIGAVHVTQGSWQPILQLNRYVF
ncbi:hypothetical protein BGY98DRAFT_977812 [Russula aff. rugulosa BPL654]|nr:hypothetical protein BGY98DRAFT_1102788 [Russula aff. rugulosa BPL654]KAI0277837.1 hypothetical protein BGY98DRAFT_977812 [Russula aff. rugulosa BPL654]